LASIIITLSIIAIITLVGLPTYRGIRRHANRVEGERIAKGITDIYYQKVALEEVEPGVSASHPRSPMVQIYFKAMEPGEVQWIDGPEIYANEFQFDWRDGRIVYTGNGSISPWGHH